MGNKLKAAAWGTRLALKINKPMIVFWLLLSVLLAVLPAVILFFYRSILGQISVFISAGTGSFNAVIPSILIMGAILTVSGISARLNDDFLYMVMFDAYYLGLEETMMDSAQRIPLSELSKKKTADEYFAVISRCGSLTDLTSSGCVLISKLVGIVSFLAVALSISAFIFCITLAYVVLSIALNLFNSGKNQVVWSVIREHLHHADYFEKLPQNGDTAKEIRIYEAAEGIKKQWNKAYAKVEEMEMRKNKGRARLNTVLETGFYIFMGIILLYCISAAGAGRMGPDTILMIISLCAGTAAAVSGISRSWHQLDYGLYGLDIQRRFFSNTPKVDPEEDGKKTDEPGNGDIIFELKNVSFAYNDEAPVLDNLSLRIRKGETLALVGINGAGKTTLIKILLGLLKPDSGEVLFMGKPYDAYKHGLINRRAGAFFQDFYLFHFTVQENVGIGNVGQVENEQMVLEAMDKGGALPLLRKLPGGLTTMVNRNVEKAGVVFSGGEGQRIAVSRTHMSDKEILIFDEPSSMLDPIAEMEQFSQIRNTAGGRTVILVSHRISFARLADRIVVLSGGGIAEQGVHDELINRNGLYAQFFHEQAQWYKTDSSGDQP
ncbi:ABC transporter ATP-binding protein [Breznakiella homolactica]|uniref:ABC transporter ATP-binding protein n=1 Tax=Breznakiella homolactica TaxID=2798577 RepID=A0A7T7XQ59_9SPIR|nr:ABC transporter ATP-binding protein [Breznakiella homolactica]QQO10486.1 ABC transporter ATP-binding protein/permease [Breznakiella homolactica]